MMIIYWQVYSRRDSIYTHNTIRAKRINKHAPVALWLSMVAAAAAARWCCCTTSCRNVGCWLFSSTDYENVFFVNNIFEIYFFKEIEERNKKRKKKINWLEKENNTHNNKKIEAVGGIIIMDIYFLCLLVTLTFFFFSFFNFSQFMQRWTHPRFIEPWLDEATTGSYQPH